MMKYTILPQTDWQVSRIAMGCWALSGDQTWGPQDEQEAIATIHAAIDAGINFFDNAELYGNGLAEEILGKALQGRRGSVIIASKFNWEHARRDEVIACCERSLRRLRTDYIDLYQIHWANWAVPFAETWEALQRLREQGKIRAIGVCNFGPKDLSAILEIGRPSTNQLPYGPLFRAIEFDIVPTCLAAGVGILCYSPLTIGLLTGKFTTADEVPAGRARTRHFSSRRPLTRHGEPGCEEETFHAIAEIGALARELGVTIPQLALAWLLRRPGVLAVVNGMRRPEQARQNAVAAEIDLDPSVIDRIESVTDPIKEKLGPNPDMWEGTERSRFR
ncbi:MAG: aldo/keto reductase [Thermogutta sp.]